MTPQRRAPGVVFLLGCARILRMFFAQYSGKYVHATLDKPGENCYAAVFEWRHSDDRQRTFTTPPTGIAGEGDKMTRMTRLMAAIFAAMFALMGTAACSAAKYQVNRPGVSIKGNAWAGGEAAAATAAGAYATTRAADADAAVAEAQADAIRVRAGAQNALAEGYAAAIRSGRLRPYGYYGGNGGYGAAGDRAYYFNGVTGVVPQSGNAPATTGAAPNASLDAVKKQAEEANRKATDALKMQKRLQERLAQ